VPAAGELVAPVAAATGRNRKVARRAAHHTHLPGSRDLFAVRVAGAR
jgi:hypothetical protein